MVRTSPPSRFAFIALALFAAGAAYAATIDAQKRKDYGRIYFGFSTPTSMRATASGTTATLSFDAPLDQSPEQLAASLPDYVRGATLSADKRTLTLTLAKPYRIRHFTSGNKVGLDLIDTKETASAPAAPIAAAPTTDAMLTTKKPAVIRASPEKPAPVATAKSKPSAPTKPPAAKPAAVAIEKQPAKKAPSMLSTKETKPTRNKKEQTPEPILTTKAEPSTKPATEEIQLPSTAPAPTTTPAPAPETASATPPAPSSHSAAAPQPPATAAPTNFTVRVKPVANQTELLFPWKERTAGAVFKRGRDVWLVFSQFRDVDVKTLATSLPASVTQVIQYADANNTILRLVTDGSLNARVAPAKTGFAWFIYLSAATTAPTQDVALNVDSLEGTQRLLLGIYDVASPLRFFDPAVGDQLVVIPGYEVGRGVATEKNYPQFSLISTAQGVAVVSRLNELEVSHNRSGTILSAPGGLAISDALPLLTNKAPVAGTSSSGIMLPYDQWFVPTEKFWETMSERLHAVAVASKTDRPAAMLELVKLQLSRGMGQEASGVLQLLREQYPQYYQTNQLALLSGASNILANRMDVAIADLAAPELDANEEATLWRQVAALYTPPPTNAQLIESAIAASSAHSDSSANSPNTTPTAEAAAAIKPSRPGFQFHKFSRPYIRFYPPAIRQKLATIAADAYLADGQEEKALAVYDTLMRDDLLSPLKQEAEFALGMVAVKKGELDQGLDAFDRVAKQVADPRSAARAAYMAAWLRYQKGLIGPQEAADTLEHVRLTWRGDAVERAMLASLVTIYTDSKRYDDVLRTQKEITTVFPGDPETLAISADMGSLFRRIYLEGLADEMEPLKALSLFYEFRDLTPLGDDGDLMIQKLADRLASLDLLDRAAGLLDNQIKFRVKGEARSRIGARLALLHLLNKNPQEALSVLDVTNYGSNAAELQTTRLQLAAEALSKLNKNEEALGVLYNDTTPTGAQLRLDILWAMRDWPNVVNHAEDILSARPNLTDPLSLKETETLLKLALAYTFEGDYTQLRYLRDYYSGLIPDTAYKQIFDFITNDTTPLDPEDFNLLAQQINRTEGFLETFKSKIAAGKLSETVE